MSKSKGKKRREELKDTTNCLSFQNLPQVQSEEEIPKEARDLLDESIEEILFDPGAQIMGFGLYEGIGSKSTKKR